MPPPQGQSAYLAFIITNVHTPAVDQRYKPISSKHLQKTHEMGGLTRRRRSLSPLSTPEIFPQIIEEDENEVPLYFLDEFGAGIIEEDEPLDDEDEHNIDNIMGSSCSALPTLARSSKKRAQSVLSSALRKPAASTPSPAPLEPEADASKFKKLVRFLDRVEIVPAPLSYYPPIAWCCSASVAAPRAGWTRRSSNVSTARSRS